MKIIPSVILQVTRRSFQPQVVGRIWIRDEGDMTSRNPGSCKEEVKSDLTWCCFYLSSKESFWRQECKLWTARKSSSSRRINSNTYWLRKCKVAPSRRQSKVGFCFLSQVGFGFLSCNHLGFFLAEFLSFCTLYIEARHVH